MTSKPTVTAPVPDGGQWETIDKGSRIAITLDLGDEFIGIYEGTEVITHPKNGETWTAYLFEGVSATSADGVVSEIKGEPCSIAAGWSLQQALNKLSGGEYTRIRQTRTTDTGQQEPMKEYRVDVRK
jgi:hypothetical protein